MMNNRTPAAELLLDLVPHPERFVDEHGNIDVPACHGEVKGLIMRLLRQVVVDSAYIESLEKYNAEMRLAMLLARDHFDDFLF